MVRISEFMFSRIEEGNQELPFTRWDIFLSVILGITLMVALSYSVQAHGWSIKRAVMVGLLMAITTVFAQNRKVALGGGLGLVALRMGIGLFTQSHPAVFLIGTVGAICGAWLLLRDLD